MVKLISSTKPDLEELQGLNLQEIIAYTARVSNPSNQDKFETSEGLIKYLIKHSHWSPFEMVGACLEINTTRDIARQILRHRSFVFQEFSQRYANPTQDLGFITREARMQDEKNRQNSIECTDELLRKDWIDMQDRVRREAYKAYSIAVASGVAKEVARAVLPEGLTGSRMYMTGSIRSWIHYIQVRSSIETQKEHRIIAQECAKAIEPIFPMIMEFVNV